MRGIILKFLFFVNSVLLITYMGWFINGNTDLDIMGLVPLILSSFMLIDITYVSSCNIRENKIISMFCGMLALDSWYILLTASESAMAVLPFTVLSPVIWFVSIKFILMFLFQGSVYKFQKAVNICLSGTCIFSLIGIMFSYEIYALLYGIQFLASWILLIFAVVCNGKRTAFVFRAEWKSIVFSLAVVTILFFGYYFSTMGVQWNLSNFGIYLPVLIFAISIHGIIWKGHDSLPLSTMFSRFQLALIMLSGAGICGLTAASSGMGFPFFFLMLDILFVFGYACNLVLDYNLKQGKNKIVRESRYHAALQQLQREEQLTLEFADFLHDDILQDLLSIKNMMNKADRPEIQKMIRETLWGMDTYIRERMQDYHPAMLAGLTVKQNYQNLLEYISQFFPHRNISISFECPDSLFLVGPYDIFVYRIFRELVTNVYKHSAGERAWIKLTQKGGMITLCVRDDGTADADVLAAGSLSGHRGLSLVMERVDSMDGSVTVSENYPHGICIQVTLPMKGDVSYQYFVS